MIQFLIERALKLLQEGSLDISIISGIFIPIVLYILQQRQLAGRMIAHEVKWVLQSPNSMSGSKPVHKIEWKIWNCGKEPIEPGHYQRPIKFTFGNKAQIIDPPIVEIKPSVAGSPPSLSINGNSSELTPILLNRRNSIRLEFLVADADIEKMTVDLQISGNDTIDVTTGRKKSSEEGALFRSIMLVLLIIWIFTFIAHIKLPQFQVMDYIFVGLAFLVFLSGTLSIMRYISAIRYR